MNDSRLRRLRDHSSDPATLISEGCKISGLITGSGDFLINGEIDGDCDLTGTVTLARNGLWRGIIKAGNIIVAGHVEGDIIAAGKVEITNTARINGTVSAEAIAVAEGAIGEGIMQTPGPSEPLKFVDTCRSQFD
jgi:cytoskeletal protein CcmA (bactofilin family)